MRTEGNVKRTPPLLITDQSSCGEDYHAGKILVQLYKNAGNFGKIDKFEKGRM